MPCSPLRTRVLRTLGKFLEFGVAMWVAAGIPRDRRAPGIGSSTPRALRAAWVIGTLVAGLQGCVSITTYTHDGEKQTRSITEFRAYAERVFRRQNALGNEILFLLDDLEQTDTELYSAAIEAERRMLDACAPLNESAARVRADEKLGVRKGRKIAASVPVCDWETDNAERVIRRISRHVEQSVEPPN